MEDTKLTQEQALDLFSALISASPDLIDDSVLEAHELYEGYSDDIAKDRQQILLRCGYAGQEEKITYDLAIGYFDESTGQPVEIIDLTRWNHQTLFIEALPLGRVGYVTDKLREYGIWGQQGTKLTSSTGWKLN